MLSSAEVLEVKESSAIMMRHAKIAFAWFLTNVTMLAGTSTHFLDIDELKSIHYDIDILEKPVLYGRPLHSEVVYLSSKFGQRYECQLPDVADVGKVQEEEKTAAETGISDLLKPMELAPCLLKSKDWWTYEFCYGKHVRQFHMDNNKISGEVITIGVFESEMDWENKSHSAAKRHRLNRYHSHRYVNGSNCDLTGKPREAEVRFLCAENELDTMSRIDEPESCRYVITVHTMRICHHPYLKPPAKAKPKTILCFPLLMQDQYDQYMHQQTKHRYSKEAQEIGSIPDNGDGEEGITQDPDDDYDYDDDDLELLEEHHLHGDLSTSGPDEVIVGEGGEIQTDLLITEVLKGVQGTIDKINSQLEDDKQSGQDGEGGDPKMMVGKTGQDGDEEMEDYDDDDDDDDDYDEEEDDEFMELLKMDYKELIKYIQELPYTDREQAMKVAKLAQEIEDSFENIEAMEKVLDIIEDMSDISPPIEDPMLSAEDPLDEVSDGPVTVLETNMKDDMEGEGLVKEEKEEDEEELKEEVKEEEGEKEKKEDHERQLTDTLNKLMRQMKEKVNFKGEATSSESKVSPQSESGDLSSRVRVRVTRVKLDKNQKASSEQELKFLDTDHQDIEQAIADQLEKSGLNKDGGGQLEVRILSYVPEEWPDQGIEDEGFAVLSEEDSSYFRNMIFGLVMKDDAEVQSQQERLQRNYGFQWDADSDLDQSQVTDKGVEQEEVHILIPKIGTKESSQGQTSSDPEH